MILAFKNAAEAERRESLIGKIIAKGIHDVTGGEYSHVQMWLDGPRSAARCFSAFEPDGTKFVTEDLTDGKLWAMIDVDGGPQPPLAQMADIAWCQGRTTRRYNFLGIVSEFFDGPLTDKYDDFCSQCCFEFLQDRRSLFPNENSVMVAPSAGKPGRIGLFQILIAAGYKVVA